MVPGTDNFITTALQLFGERAPNGEYLPLFNVIRVDFSTGIGRPSRKFLRTPIGELMSQGGLLDVNTLADINNNYVAPLVGLAGFVDVDGEQITGGAAFRPIAMRQLRRGSKRRLQPIIP